METEQSTIAMNYGNGRKQPPCLDSNQYYGWNRGRKQPPAVGAAHNRSLSMVRGLL